MDRNSILTRLYDIAEARDGYFSTFEAESHGISNAALAKHAARGTLRRLSRGVYRLAHFPEMTPNSHLWAALLWPNSRSEVKTVLSHVTALRLHDLSDVNPDTTHVTVPVSLRIRRDAPTDLIIHHADLPDYDVEFVDGLPTTTVDRTLRDIAASGNAVILHDALRDARRLNLPIPRELKHV